MTNATNATNSTNATNATNATHATNAINVTNVTKQQMHYAAGLTFVSISICPLHLSPHNEQWVSSVPSILSLLAAPHHLLLTIQATLIVMIPHTGTTSLGGWRGDIAPCAGGVHPHQLRIVPCPLWWEGEYTLLLHIPLLALTHPQTEWLRDKYACCTWAGRTFFPVVLSHQLFGFWWEIGFGVTYLRI